MFLPKLESLPRKIAITPTRKLGIVSNSEEGRIRDRKRIGK